MAEKKKSIEENLQRLDEIIEKLSAEDATLTDSIKNYTEGVGIIKECQESLEQVEKQIIELTKETSDEEQDK